MNTYTGQTEAIGGHLTALCAYATHRFGWGSPDICLGYTVTVRRKALGDPA
jgi:hypothetical protein